MVWEKNCSELFFTPHHSSRAGKLHFSEQLKTAPFKPYIVAEVAFAYGEVDVELAILAVVWREMHADRPVGGVRKNRKNRGILFGQGSRETRPDCNTYAAYWFWTHTRRHKSCLEYFRLPGALLPGCIGNGGARRRGTFQTTTCALEGRALRVGTAESRDS